ncbi:MAG: hypothetical protein ACRC0A_05910 [Chitinophagaceae bacterium]
MLQVYADFVLEKKLNEKNLKEFYRKQQEENEILPSEKDLTPEEVILKSIETYFYTPKRFSLIQDFQQKNLEEIYKKAQEIKTREMIKQMNTKITIKLF